MLLSKALLEEDSNAWPAMADLALVTALLMTFFLIVQVALSAERTAVQLEVERNQQLVATSVIEAAEEAARTTRTQPEADTDRTTSATDASKNDDNCTQYGSTLTICVDGNLQRFRFSDRVLFDRAKANIKPAGIAILSAIGSELKKHEQSFSRISIEGHTDDVPIKSGIYDSNWELSSARATSVLRLLESLGLHPKLLSATGYGEYQRLVPGDSEDARSLNRRVELAVVYSPAAILQRLSGKLIEPPQIEPTGVDEATPDAG